MRLTVVFTVLLSIAHASQNASLIGGCCKNLDCFWENTTWVMDPRELPPPKCPPELLVSFKLYTRNNNANPHVIETWPNMSSDAFHYDVNKTTMIFIRDYRGSTNDSLTQDLKDAYLDKVDANVILPDWDEDFGNCSYHEAVSNGRIVAAQISRLLKYLISTMTASPSKFHLIGFGVGAHTAGFVGKTIKGIARITGLDPARPLFYIAGKEIRLDVDDAIFVDIIHTNCHPVTGISTCDSTGHVDMYINGGLTQPVCPIIVGGRQVTAFTEDDYSAFYEKSDMLNMMCSHNTAVRYLTESLANKNCTFWGVVPSFFCNILDIFTYGLFAKFCTNIGSCTIKSCVPLGLDTMNYPARGSFDIATSDEEPFCISNPTVDASMKAQLKASGFHFSY